jgi:hypothetical protein
MRQNMPTSRDVLKMVIKGIKTDSLAYEMSLLSRLVYIIYLHRTIVEQTTVVLYLIRNTLDRMNIVPIHRMEQLYCIDH